MNKHLWFQAIVLVATPACIGEPASVVSGAAPLAADGSSIGAEAGSQAAAAAAETTQSPQATAGVAVQPTVATPASKPMPFVVHEWGTFTSVQGSNGGTLDGLHHEEEELPKFVYGRSELGKNQKMLEGLPEPCNQKMETPVVYFYSDIARKVKLHVTFTDGIISQWFPAATQFLPKVGALGGDWFEATSGLSKGSIDWSVLVDPALDMHKAPSVSADSVWLPSRQTAATPLRYVGMGHNYKDVDETERFLFYRGLGRFVLPVQVKADKGGALQVVNASADVLPFAVLLHTTAGGMGGVVELGALAANQARKAAVPQAKLPMDQAIAAAKNSLKGALVASGLYADESQAMVDTWQKSWFASEGVRLLYILPRPWTDKLLPLNVEPAADQLVRTLVGRIEVLTPESEAEALTIVQKSKAAGTLDAHKTMGRFAEPRIRRACQMLYSKAELAHCAQLAQAASKAP